MINVVMLIKDRPRLTEQSLDTLLRHTSSPFNLTLIDDSSLSFSYASDIGVRRAVWAGGFSGWTSMRVEKSKGITGMARNLGVYWAEKYWGRGDWLYLSDNDVYFTEGWDEKLTSLLRVAGSVRVLAGSTHPYHGANPWPPGASTDAITLHDAVSGYSQLMRWDIWDAYGPLDAHAPGIRQSEDWAFCQKIIKDGLLVGSINPPVVYDCGLTDTFGEPAIGVEQIPRYEGIIQE